MCEYNNKMNTQTTIKEMLDKHLDIKLLLNADFAHLSGDLYKLPEFFEKLCDDQHPTSLKRLYMRLKDGHLKNPLEIGEATYYSFEGRYYCGHRECRSIVPKFYEKRPLSIEKLIKMKQYSCDKLPAMRFHIIGTRSKHGNYHKNMRTCLCTTHKKPCHTEFRTTRELTKHLTSCHTCPVAKRKKHAQYVANKRASMDKEEKWCYNEARRQKYREQREADGFTLRSNDGYYSKGDEARSIRRREKNEELLALNQEITDYFKILLD